MDYDDLESKFRSLSGRSDGSGRVKGIIFCNPHNPVGRLWNKEETVKMGDIVIDNGRVVISDEILFKGYKHTPFASFSEKFEQNSVVCISPSKTFNLAGLEVSTIIIPNEKLLKEFLNVKSGIVPNPNLFGYTALEAAYNFGDKWLEQVLDYLQKNLDIVRKYLEAEIPDVRLIELHGTYLLWLDFRKLGLRRDKLQKLLIEDVKVGMEEGFIFSEGGNGFMRMNITTPRTYWNRP